MPEIVFKGKEYVYNHHLTVPYRPLVAHKDKGIGAGDLASNLVIHGDNLHALKALLPRYASQVDLVSIVALDGGCAAVECDLVFDSAWRSTMSARYFS